MNILQERICSAVSGSSAHSTCRINLKLTKNVLVIFYKFKGYDGNSTMQEISKFDVEKVLYQMD